VGRHRLKSLKRHLRTQYAMTPEQYREKWRLPADYPMVAPNYAKARSELAKSMGLGQQRKRATKAGNSGKGRAKKAA
jgi:predicted transcriptional regulator